jgi:hypothetical protein
MNDATSRRQLLAYLAGGTAALAGCNTDESGTTTETTEPATRPSTTTTTATESPTETEEETATDEEWEVDPVDHDKLVGAYYYQWYHGADGYGLHDDRPWLEHVPAEPVLGQYHSRDEDVINQHIKWALEHGINWFMAHGAAPGDYDEVTLRNHVLEAELADRMQFSLITGIPNEFRDEQGQFDMDDPDLRRSVGVKLAEYESTYFDRENYLTVDGAPLVMFFAVGNMTGDVIEAWDEIRDALDGDTYLLADPRMGYSPGFAGFDTPARELAEAFDGLSGYDLNPILQLQYGEFDREDFQRHLRDWRIATEDYGVDFIPMTLPGEDHSEIDWKEPRNFYLERTPDRFRRLCRDARRYRDPDLDAVLVTSFNEWPEYTAVEPAESYGTTYLEIAEEELARGQQDPFQTDQYVSPQFDFNRAINEQDLNPEAQSSRKLAFQLNGLVVESEDGTAVAAYDVGVPEDEPVFTEGVYRAERNPNADPDSWRWLGGKSERTISYLDSDPDNAATLQVTGRPASGEITAAVRFDNQDAGQVTFDDGIGEYRISLPV